MQRRDRRAAGDARPRAGASRRRCRATAPRRRASAATAPRDYDELIDHPVEMRDFAHVAFEAGGVAARHRGHAVAQRADLDAPRARPRARLPVADRPLRRRAGGAAPFDRYLFQVAAVGDGYGGLEHRASTSLLCRARRPAAARASTASTTTTAASSGLASHEYFHSWNVKRIKPAAFVPYDLARESYTRQLWAFEGITSYYDDLALRAQRRHRRRELPRAPRPHDHRGAAHARPARAERRRVELRRLDQVLPAGREHAQRRRQLLRARARWSRSRSTSRCARDGCIARRADARAVASATAQPASASPRTASPALASELAGRDLARLLRALRRRHRGSAARRTAARRSASTLQLRAADGGDDRGGTRGQASPTRDRAAALGATHRGRTEPRSSQHVFAGGPARARGAGGGRHARRRRRAARIGRACSSGSRRAAAPAKRSACTRSAATSC